MEKVKTCYNCKEIVTFCSCDKSITDRDEYIKYLESIRDRTVKCRENILKDKLFLSKTAHAAVNLPLSLIQLSLTQCLHTTERILNVPLTDVKKLRGEK